jgi:hypothetical protein
MSDNQKITFAQVRAKYDVDVAAGKKAMIIGDFNSSIFSPIMHRYFGDLSKRLLYTWNRGKIWQLPIDHALTQEDIKVTIVSKKTSDHAALVIDLVD